MRYLEELFSVAGKTALVTGGGTGIGKMIASALARGGAHVFICSRKLEAVMRASAEINALVAEENGHGMVDAFVGDVSTEEGVTALVKALRERTSKVDILVNNAGVSWGDPLGTFPHSAWGGVGCERGRAVPPHAGTVARAEEERRERRSGPRDQSGICHGVYADRRWRLLLLSLQGRRASADAHFGEGAGTGAHHLQWLCARTVPIQNDSICDRDGRKGRAGWQRGALGPYRSS